MSNSSRSCLPCPSRPTQSHTARGLFALTQLHRNEVPLLPAAHPERNHPQALVHLSGTGDQSLRDRAAPLHDGSRHPSHALHRFSQAQMSSLRKRTRKRRQIPHVLHRRSLQSLTFLGRLHLHQEDALHHSHARLHLPHYVRQSRTDEQG